MNVFPDKFRFSFEKNGERYECKYSPDEWNNNVLNWTRSIDNAETLVKYTTSFTFIKEDAGYLRDCYEDTGVFSKVKFIIEQYDYNEFTYKPYYSGDIDFYSYERNKHKVSIVTTDIGYRASVMANLDTTYEIKPPVFSDFVRYDRLQLKNAISFSGDMDLNDISSLVSAITPLYITAEDTVGGKVVTQSIADTALNDLDNTQNDLWVLNVNSNVSLNISVEFDFTIKLLPRDQSGYLLFSMLKGKDVKSATLTELGRASISKNQEYTYLKGSYSLQNFSVNTGEKIYFMIRADKGGYRVDSIKSNTDTKVDINYYDRAGQSKDIYGMRPLALLKELLNKATGGKYNTIKSSALSTGEISKMLITSGDLIRDIENAKIKTSLKDFFQAMKSMFGLSYTFRVIDGIETMEVEHMNYFYSRTTMITEVGDINELSEKVKDNSIYNKLKIGYDDQTYDEVNGKKEFNTTLEFAIETDHEGKELNLISPYRADMYGIEFTLIDYEQKETTDAESDNDVFIMHMGSPVPVIMNGYYLNRSYKILNSDNYAGSSAFNIYLSPKRCLLRQIEYIKSLFMFSGNLLEFASSPKDFNVESTGGIVEHANVDLSLYDYLFKPVTFEFETMVPWNLPDLIQDGYRGYIKAIDGDEVIRGFIESVSENPGRNKSQKWKLISL